MRKPKADSCRFLYGGKGYFARDYKSQEGKNCLLYGEVGHFANICKNSKGKECFLCHQVGHFKKDCPTRSKEGLVVQAYVVHAVPTSSTVPMAREKGKGITINLEGILSVFNIQVRVLFDIGASRSFIYNVLISRLNLELVIIDKPLEVCNLVGGSTCLSIIYLGV